MSQLLDLSRPFPQRVIHDNPSGGGSYVAHHLYVQRLLMHLGAYSFERVEVLRGFVPEKAPNPNGSSKRAKEGVPALSDAIVGVVCRLTVTVDRETMVIEDVGDCEDPHNWPHDGARLKDAMSDALKRCCARIGLGTHLYAKGEEYVLFDKLKEQIVEDDPPQQRKMQGELKVQAPRPIVDANDPTAWINDEADAGRPFQDVLDNHAENG